ncbi:hypothetical protein R6Q57_001504 [Mikania cordata]
MPASATMIGALLGLGTQMYSNALRKLPYMRHPWEHVLGMGLGAVFANQLVKWDAKLQQDLDKMLDKAKAANERRYFGLTRHCTPYGPKNCRLKDRISDHDNNRRQTRRHQQMMALNGSNTNTLNLQGSGVVVRVEKRQARGLKFNPHSSNFP